MQVEPPTSTIEKQEVRLLDEYHKCLELLYNGRIDEGIEGLKALLQNPIAHNKEFDELRYSIYQSLAELNEKHCSDLVAAVYYLHEAIKIRDDFLEWKRLGGLCRRKGFLEQAQFCLKKAIALSPILNRDILLEELCELLILNNRQNQAIELAEELIERKFRVERIKALKLTALQQLLEQPHLDEFQKRRYVLQRDVLQSEGAAPSASLVNEKRLLKQTTKESGQHEALPQPLDSGTSAVTASPFLVRPASGWGNLLAKLYLILKHGAIKDVEREKRKKNNRIYKQLEEFFSNRKMHSEPIKIVTELGQLESEVASDAERLDQLADSYLAFKRKKNKEAGPISKLSTGQPDRQLVRITGKINPKDYVSNPSVHIDSLVHLQCKLKRKDMSKLSIMKNISEELCPGRPLYPSFFARLQEPIQMIEILETDRNAGDRTTTTVDMIEAEEPQQDTSSKGGLERPAQNGSKPTKKASDLEKLAETALRQDFLQFCNGIAGLCFVNIFELARRVVLHFTHNRPRQAELFDITSKEPLQESLDFSPSYFLKGSEEACIKSFVKRIYLLTRRFCSGVLFPQPSCKVTLLELTVERYQDINNKTQLGKSKDLWNEVKRKKQQLHAHIVALEGQLFFRRDFADYMQGLSDKAKLLLKLRVYHCLAIFFSQAGQENLTMLQKLVQKYEHYQEEYKSKTGDLSVSLFWLDLAITKPNLANYLEHRLKENRLLTELEQREVGRTEEMAQALRNSIDNFRSAKDKSVAEAVDLYYKNIIEMMSDELLPVESFLHHLGDLLTLYLEILEKKPNRQDYSRFISKIDDLMKLDELVQQLIKRCSGEREVQGRTLELSVRLSNLFLRIVLTKYFVQENENHNNSNVIRGLMCCLTVLIKSMSEEQRNNMVPELVLLMHMLAHIPSDNVSVHRKINTHFMSKFIEYLYDDKRMLQPEEGESGQQQEAKPQQAIANEEKEERDRMAKSENEESQSSENEHTSFRCEAEDALKCYYGFSQKKLVEFVPSNYKEIENFTRYLRIFHPKYFEEPSTKIKIPICNILRAAEKILIEEKAKFCAGLEESRKKLIDMYINGARDEDFLGRIAQIIDGNPCTRLCTCEEARCFEQVRQNHSAMVDTYYMVGRSLENEEYTDNEGNRTEVQRNYRHAEKLYQVLVCLDASQGRSWYCLFKINKKKAYVYFDSLIYEEQPAELRSCFLTAKKLAVFIKDHPKLLSEGLRCELEDDLFILNLLKIFERKFLYMQKKQSTPHDIEAISSRENKMVEAEQTIIGKLQNRSTRIQYLSLVYLIKPYEMHCNFHSATCTSLTRQFVELRRAVAQNEEEDGCKLTDEDVYPELLFFLLKVITRYVSLMKFDKPNSPVVFADLVEWLENVRELVPQLLVGEPSQPYYQMYLNKDPAVPAYRGRAPRHSTFSSTIQRYRQTSKVRESLPPPEVTIAGINTIIQNARQYMRQFLTVKVHSKKSKLMRNYTTCCFQLSRLQLRFEGNSAQALATMSELVNIKFDDIIQVYRYYESQSLERDAKLSEFFNRNLFFMLSKYKYVKYVISLYFDVCDYDKVRVLYKKLSKLLQPDTGRTNQVFMLLHRICLDVSISSLWEMLVSHYNEEFEKWLLELYEKIIKPKKNFRSEHSSAIKSIIAAYYLQKQREINPSKEIPEAGRFERGLLLLEEKHRKKKVREPGHESKKSGQVMVQEPH